MAIQQLSAWLSVIVLALISCHILRQPLGISPVKEFPRLHQDVRLWPNLVKAIPEGKGSCLGRTEEVMEELRLSRQEYSTPKSVAEYTKETRNSLNGSLMNILTNYQKTCNIGYSRFACRKCRKSLRKYFPSGIPPVPASLPYAGTYLPRTRVFPIDSKSCDRKQLPYLRQDVRLWPNLVKAILEGKGSCLGRTEEVMEELRLARQEYSTPKAVAKYIKGKLNWQGLSHDSDRLIWDPRVYRNKEFLKWKLNEYPYELPENVEHWILWIRVPEVSEKSFEPLSGEVQPDSGFSNPNRVATLVDYIKDYDYYGFYGLVDALSPEIRFNDFAHPTSHHLWVHPKTGKRVNRMQGHKAMQWSGRHINTVLQEKFPEDQYEVLWNRSPNRVKSCLEPEHIHVIVRPK